jgi:hypothetical protein
MSLCELHFHAEENHVLGRFLLPVMKSKSGISRSSPPRPFSD